MTANSSAIKFIGASKDRIDFGSSAKGTSIKNTTAFTLECDIKVGATTNPEARAYLERQSSGKNPRLALAAYNDSATGKGVLRFEFSRRDNKSDTNYTYLLTDAWDDYWHHVAFTVDVGEKEYNIYLDGAKVAVGKVPDGGKDGSNNPLPVANTTPLDIIVGAGYNGSTYNYWDGKIDNIRVWNTVVSQGTIISNSHDHLANPGSESSLLEEWRFNENTGTTTNGIKNASWSATLKRNGSSSSALWTPDRPFMGDGSDDEQAPTVPTMLAPTNITSNGFTLNFSGSTDDVYVQYYEITVATDNAFVSPVVGYAGRNVGLVSTFTVTGLTPATNYYAKVRALDAALNASDASMYNTNAAIVTSASGDVSAPNAPVASSATSITYQNFTANWAASTSPDETGYKLDVATDPLFVDIVPSYRNLDVGNVLTYVINLGVLSSTTYYYRLRAYDAAGNESVDSNVISLTTAQTPDITAPNIVILKPATSVASASFTANWEEGSDNVGVTGYRIDLSQSETFSSFVVENLNVGNVTAYAFSGLIDVTSYYYRVRAYDAAGNISANTGTPEQVNTTSALINDSDYYLTRSDAAQDTYLKSAVTGAAPGNEDTLVLSSTDYAYIQFDLAGILGTIINADMYLFNDAASSAWSTGNAIRIEYVTGNWDESTLTYANQTFAFSGNYVEVYPVSTNAYMNVDIASILPDGITTATLAVKLPATKTGTFHSRTNPSGNMPYLNVTADPSTATQIDRTTISATNFNYTNYIKNPSGEIGGPSYGGTTGITTLSATLTQSTDFAYDGLYSCKVVTPASINTGVSYASPTGLAIAGTGQTVKGCAMLYSTTALTGLQLYLKLTYTDASSTIGTAITVGTIANQWIRYDATVVATNAKTVDKIEVVVVQTTAAARTFYVDAVASSITPYDLVFFHGGTNADTDWNGTAHASTSTLSTVLISVTETYLGDANDNNSASAALWEEDGSRVALMGYTPAINRTTKQITWTQPPVMNSNWLFNPSFTYSNNIADYWTVTGSGSYAHYTDVAHGVIGDQGVRSFGIQGLASGDGITNKDWNATVVGDKWTFSAWIANFDATVKYVTVKITEYSSALAVLTTHTQIVATTPNGIWTRASVSSPVTDANAKFISVSVTTNSAFFLYIDDCQLVKQDVITDYNSGEKSSGQFSGSVNSQSWWRVRHELPYVVEMLVTDVDDVIGVNPQDIEVITPDVPEDIATLDTLLLEADTSRINVTFTYLGDDNSSTNFLVKWKRSDLSNWNNVVYSLNRSTRTLYAVISGLRSGTQYDVQVIAKDTDDLVFGGVAINANSAYMQSSAVTTIDTALAGASSTLVSFDGFILQRDDVNWIGVTYHDAYNLPDRDVQVEKLARVDGAIELARWWDKKEINIKGIVKASSRVELEDRIREFRRAMSVGQRPLIVDTLDSNGYYWMATCESLDMPEKAGENFTHLEWSARFVCADPFRYAPTDTSENLIELANAGTVSITNDGDLSLFPTFTLTTASTDEISVTLFNQTTGERMLPTTTISTGDTLVINSARSIVTKNQVRIDYEGSFPSLAVGPNTIKVTLSEDTVYLSVQRRHRYF